MKRKSENELTRCELEALNLYVRGFTAKQVAERLGKAVKTVEKHRQHAGRKLGVCSNIAMIRVAIRTGVVPVEVFLESHEGEVK